MKNTYTSYSKPHTKDLLFKFIYHATKTNSYIYKISRDKTGTTSLCDYCRNLEDNIHLFTTCNKIKKIWTHFQPTYKKLAKRQYTLQQHIFTLSTNNLDTKNKKLTVTLTQIIMCEIWISRNKLKYDKIQITQETIITQIITHLRNIITAH